MQLIAFLKNCLICIVFSVLAAACSGTLPGPKQDPDWVKQPSGQSTNWSVYEDMEGGGR